MPDTQYRSSLVSCLLSHQLGTLEEYRGMFAERQRRRSGPLLRSQSEAACNFFKKKRTYSLLSRDMRYGRSRGLRDNTQTALRMNRRTRLDRQYARGSYQMHHLGRLCVEVHTRHEMYETQTGSVVAYSETSLLCVVSWGEILFTLRHLV